MHPRDQNRLSMYSPTTKRSGDLPAMPPAYSPRSRMFDAGALEEKRRELFSTNRNSHFSESVTNQTNPSWQAARLSRPLSTGDTTVNALSDRSFADEDYLLHTAYPPTCPSLSEKVEIMTVHSFESARSSMPSNGLSNPHTSAQNDNKQSCLWKFLSAPPLGYVLWPLLCILSLGLVVLAMALGLLLGQVVLHAARPLDSGYVSSIAMSLRVGAVGGTVLCIPTALILLLCVSSKEATGGVVAVAASLILSVVLGAVGGSLGVAILRGYRRRYYYGYAPAVGIHISGMLDVSHAAGACALGMLFISTFLVVVGAVVQAARQYCRRGETCSSAV